MTASVHGTREGRAFLLAVSPEHRRLALRQYAIQQFATWCTALALTTSNWSNPRLPREQLYAWMGVFLASWAVRMVMVYPLYRLTPQELARRPLFSALPLLTGLVGIGFWVWSIPIFSGPGMETQRLIMCAGFFCISTSMMAMWSVTPATALAYYVLLWGAFSHNLLTTGQSSWPAVIALNALVIAMLTTYLFSSVQQIRQQVLRSAELDRALESAHSANLELAQIKDRAVLELADRTRSFEQASHDLRQRLHAIRLWISTAMDDIAPGTKARYPLVQIAEHVGALEGYFSKVMEHARLQAKGPLHLSPVPVHAIFQSLELGFEHPSTLAKVDLRVLHARAVLYTNQSVLLRVMENLVENALGHCRSGVLVAARTVGNTFCLDVYDDGQGVPESAVGRIFDAFYQHEPTDDSRRKGAGLGLAIVRQLTEQLGAKVHVKSVPGRGTRFRVAMPKSSLR